MGVFKNGVGRPSNETIKKRNIFKVICVLLILVIIVLIGYILNDKNVDNKEPKTTTKNVNKTDSKYKNIVLNSITFLAPACRCELFYPRQRTGQPGDAGMGEQRVDRSGPGA